MRRREWLALACGSVASAMAGCATGGKAHADARPNVLFLLTDDQRFDTIHALGQSVVETPHLDRLTARGCAFTRAHIMGGSDPAVCMPSRAMLLTGRGLFHLRDRGRVIPPETPTLPEVFGHAGYETFVTGKWHQDTAALVRSFESGHRVFVGGMGDHFNLKVLDFTRAEGLDRERARVESGVHSSELFADAALHFIQQRDTARPFFAYVSFMAPHDPRSAPADFHAKYAPNAMPLPPGFMGEHPFDNGELEIRDELLAEKPRREEDIKRHLADYYAMITHLDVQVGRILDGLASAGLEDHTIVVFASDNGLALGQHGLMGKQSLYEHSVRVPLVLASPGIASGVRSEALCLLPEVNPTLCELAGVPVPASVELTGLVPALSGGAYKGREALYFAYRDFQRAVTDGRWKLIVYNVQGKQRRQLFDLKSDPWETTDLSGDAASRGVLGRMEALLREEGERWDDTVDFEREHWGLLMGVSTT